MYKYGGAIIKTFAAACAGGTLAIMDPIFFGIERSPSSYAGALVLFLATYMFMDAGNVEKLEAAANGALQRSSNYGGMMRITALAAVATAVAYCMTNVYLAPGVGNIVADKSDVYAMAADRVRTTLAPE